MPDDGTGSEGGIRPIECVGETREEVGGRDPEANPSLARELPAAAAVLERTVAREGAEGTGAPERLALEAGVARLIEDTNDETDPLGFTAA